MFIVSFKTSRKKILIYACALLVLVTVIIVLCSRGHQATATMSGGQYSLKAETSEDRIAFFKQFGWEVAEKPIEVSEVTIPQTFNTVYENYNKMQKEQGLDLSKYQGKTCKQWVYEITNYPSQAATVRGTLLVLDNVVIGGDISSASLNGFICGFAGQKDVNDPDLECSPSEEAATSSTPKTASSAVGANKTTSSTKKTASTAAQPKKTTSSAAKATSSAKSTKSAVPTAAWPTD